MDFSTSTKNIVFQLYSNESIPPTAVTNKLHYEQKFIEFDSFDSLSFIMYKDSGISNFHKRRQKMPEKMYLVLKFTSIGLTKDIKCKHPPAQTILT